MIQDNYVHPVSEVTYIKESMLGPGGDKEGFHTWFETTCSCLEHSCSTSECKCTQTYGINYIQSLLITEKLINEYCVYECSAFCSCSDLCSNKVVQKGPYTKLYIQKTTNKGFGVFTLDRIVPGTFICEYTGEIISKSEAQKRYNENNDNKYILLMREHYSGNVVETCVDAFSYGNISRYINHSCSPNCVIIPVRTGCLIPKLAIFSSKLIEKNEEISYSYGQGISTVSNSVCFCNSANCKGYLPSSVAVLQ